jgi:hypothetical protein
MRMKNSFVIVLCLFTIGLITACRPSAEIDIDDLYGVWHSDYWGVFSFMNDDETWLISETNGPEFPVQFGEYSLKGMTLTFVRDDDSPFCAGTTVVVEAKFIDDDKYQETILETNCDEGLAPGDTTIWIRVSP